MWLIRLMNKYKYKHWTKQELIGMAKAADQIAENSRNSGEYKTAMRFRDDAFEYRHMAQNRDTP